MTADGVVSIGEERRRRKLVDARLTDVGNAKRMVELFGQDLRYMAPAELWYVWDGRRWAEDQLLAVERRARDTAHALWEEAKTIKNKEKANEYFKHAFASENNTRVRAMIARARAEEGITIGANPFDADPWILTCMNGVIDLKTGALLAHDRARLCSKLTPIEYPEREGAECPLWLSCLDTWLAGDRELIDYLQRAVGYTLTGDTGAQCLHLLHGHGANGKSVFLETVALLLGEFAIASDFTAFLDSVHVSPQGASSYIARLAGARMVHSSEIGEGKRLNEALVKSLTGNDTITARYQFAREFSFTPTHKLWLGANHRPRIRSTDHAMWRRLRLVPFEVTIPPEKRDRELGAKLAAELPGILRWAVDGCLAWQRDGLEPPKSILSATQQYRTDSDTLGAFIADCCQLGEGLKTQSTVLYEAYKKWAKDGEEYLMSQTDFGLKLNERGIPTNEKRPKCRYGIALLDNPQEDHATLF